MLVDPQIRGFFTPEKSTLSSLIEAVVAGDGLDLCIDIDPLSCADPEGAKALDTLISRMRSRMLEISSAVETAAAGARGAEVLREATLTAQSQADNTESIQRAVQESAGGAGVVAQSAARSRVLAERLADRSISSFHNIEQALLGLGEVENASAECVESVRTLTQAAEEISGFLQLINEIGERTNMLALNASIEAARAGQSGAAFRVVAREMRSLADSTQAETTRIAATVKRIRENGATATSVTLASTKLVSEVARRANETQHDLEAMSAMVTDSVGEITAIATTAEQQAAALMQVSLEVDQAQLRARDIVRSMTQATNSGDLADLNRVFARMSQGVRLGRFAERVVDIGQAEASRIESALDVLKRDGIDIFDTNYIELKGDLIDSLSGVCNVVNAPRSGFDPPKFMTAWSVPSDVEFMAAVDRIMAREPRLDFACIVDINGFLTMHAAKYRRALSGNTAVDFTGNRIKRFFTDSTGLRAARCGIAQGWDTVGERASRAAFRAAGISLAGGGARLPIVQTYARDTGDIMNDVAIPLFAGGSIWGALRLCYAVGIE